MSEIIGSKEAKLAWANGEKVEYYKKDRDEWFEVRGNTYVSVFDIMDKFRLKPKTITINGIEVPAPFEPKDGEEYWYIVDSECGCSRTINTPNLRVGIAAWRTEEEIKQVVAALRKVFKGE